ncbi:hypothetical protein Tco_1051164 [Tanacetum coccineum]
MATEPNEVRRETLRRPLRELVADVELANNLLHELNRYLDQLRTHAPELLRVEALSDEPFIKYGFSALERASFSDMTNSNKLVAVRTELLRTITDKAQMINHYKNIRDDPRTAPMMTIMIVVSTEKFKKEAPQITAGQSGCDTQPDVPTLTCAPGAHRWNASPILNAAEPFEEPLILSVEDKVRPNKDDVLGRCMLPSQYVERRLDHKAINTRRFNLEKHVMVIEGEKIKEVKFASKIHMKYINPINGP